MIKDAWYITFQRTPMNASINSVVSVLTAQLLLVLLLVCLVTIQLVGYQRKVEIKCQEIVLQTFKRQFCLSSCSI